MPVFERAFPDTLGGMYVTSRTSGRVFHIAQHAPPPGCEGALTHLDLPFSVPVPWGAMDNDFQYILGEDAPYLLVARYDAWYEFKENKMFAFVPGTLQVASQQSLALDFNERLEVALAGGGVPFTAPAYGHSLQFAPALSGSWYQAPTPPAAPLAGPSLQVSSPSVSDVADWAYEQGSARGGRIGRYTYRTMDAAAFATVREHVPNSAALGREFGGSICKTPANRYFGSTPNVGDNGEVSPSMCPAGNTRTGEYHTHVGLTPLDGFYNPTCTARTSRRSLPTSGSVSIGRTEP